MVMSPTAGPEAQSLWKRSERIRALEWGLETGTGWKQGHSSFLILAASPFPLPSARATNSAPAAFRSMYRKTVNRCSSLCTGKLLNRP